MSHTTDRMKEIAGMIARIITENGQKIGVDECIVDDFGRYGNFSLLCYLDFHKQGGRGYYPNDRAKFSLVKIVYLIKKIISSQKDKGAILRGHECPQGIYSQQRIRNFTKSYFEGYERRYISIDLDFIPYHAESNTFAVQNAPEPVIVEQNPRGQQLNLF